MAAHPKRVRSGPMPSSLEMGDEGHGTLEALDEVLAGVDGGGVTASEAIEQFLGSQILLRDNRRRCHGCRPHRSPSAPLSHRQHPRQQLSDAPSHRPLQSAPIAARGAGNSQTQEKGKGGENDLMRLVTSAP